MLLSHSGLKNGLVSRLWGHRASAPNFAEPAYLSLPPGKSLLHVTHWKAGSQWIRRILQDAFGPAIEPPATHTAHVFEHPVKEGKVYPCVYVNKHEFDCLSLPEQSSAFVVIRDLRDTLVSGYFSWRYSHRIEWFPMEKCRRVLNQLSEEEGLLYMFDEFLPKAALMQRTWLESGARCWKLEDFTTDAAGNMKEVLEDLEIAVDQPFLEEIVGRNSFCNLSGGRQAGQEDLESHYRKGVAGDWKAHFTPGIKARFKHLYNDLLIQAGYESNSDW
jgi:lipopolysaccharide transport system ATP-binding protein